MTFLKSNFVVSWLNENFDICFITETHLCVDQFFEIENFFAYHNCFSNYDSKHPRGRISCFISPKLIQYIADVSVQITNYIIIKFKSEDVLFGNYIPPTDSFYFNHDDFSGVCNILTPKNQTNNVFGGGDMNARVGDVNLNLHSLCYKYRRNPDKIINLHGRELLKICKSFKCFIVNNLTVEKMEITLS